MKSPGSAWAAGRRLGLERSLGSAGSAASAPGARPPTSQFPAPRGWRSHPTTPAEGTATSVSGRVALCGVCFPVPLMGLLPGPGLPPALSRGAVGCPEGPAAWAPAISSSGSPSPCGGATNHPVCRPGEAGHLESHRDLAAPACGGDSALHRGRSITSLHTLTRSVKELDSQSGGRGSVTSPSPPCQARLLAHA